MHDIKASCKWKVKPSGSFVIKMLLKFFFPLILPWQRDHIYAGKRNILELRVTKLKKILNSSDTV